jgi:hypothetical protein
MADAMFAETMENQKTFNQPIPESWRYASQKPSPEQQDITNMLVNLQTANLKTSICKRPI